MDIKKETWKINATSRFLKKTYLNLFTKHMDGLKLIHTRFLKYE